MTISHMTNATLTQIGWETSSRVQCSLLSRRKIRGALDRHPDAAVTSLIPALSCRSCRPNAPFAELVRLSRTSIADEMRDDHRLLFVSAAFCAGVCARWVSEPMPKFSTSTHGDLRNAPFSLALIRHSNRVSAKIRFGCRETRFYEAETRAPKRPPKSCR
jgi:hypothetical protein